MAKESEFREPERGEKSTLIRELLAKHPNGKNMELAAMYLDKMRAMKVKEERDLAQIAQSFAQEKSTAKKKLENAPVPQAPAPAAPVALVAPVAKTAPAKAASNGTEETPAKTALRQMVSLIGKDGVKKLVESL